MKIISYRVKYTLLTILLVGICFNFISCTTVDYFTFANIPHSSKIVGSNQISLITYNIKAIYEKEKNQIDKLMEYVNSEQFDFVIFQELFNERTRDYIINRANTTHYSTIVARVDYNSIPEFIFQDAGLFLMGSHPRIDLSNIEFDGDIHNSSGAIHMLLKKEISKTNDFLANKSILGILFEINENTKLFLFTTHVQAIGTTENKEAQLKQIKTFIDTAVDSVLKSGTVKSSKNLVVLLAGDFNSNAYDKERFKRMESILGYPRDLHREFNGEKEEYTFRFNQSNATRRFDYILAYDSIGQIPLKKVSVQSIGVIDIVDDENNSISDHLGLRAVIEIN